MQISDPRRDRQSYTIIVNAYKYFWARQPKPPVASASFPIFDSVACRFPIAAVFVSAHPYLYLTFAIRRVSHPASCINLQQLKWINWSGLWVSVYSFGFTSKIHQVVDCIYKLSARREFTPEIG